MGATDPQMHAASSETPPGDSVLHPVYITRVAGEPVGILDGLGTGETARLAGEIAASRERLARDGEELAGILEAMIPKLDPHGIRAALNLKRAMFNGRPIKPSQLTLLADALEPATYERIARYGEELGQLAEREASIVGAFEHELVQGTDTLLAMLQRRNFVDGLSYSNPELLREFRERLPLDSTSSARGKTRRNLEDSLLQYGARVATKTSPLSSFTVLGVDRWGESGNGLELAFSGDLERRISFKGALFRHLIAAILSDFERAANLALLEINPSAQVHDNRLHLKAVTSGSLNTGRFWGTGEDRVETANNAVMTLIASIFDGRDRQPIVASELVDAVCAKAPKLDQAAVWQFLAKLYQIQYLRPVLGTFDQDDPMETYDRLVARMEGEVGEELRALADRMKENAARFQAGDSAERGRAMGLLHADVRRTCEILGLESGLPLFKPVLFENCYVRSAGEAAAPADLEPHTPDLELLLETAVLTDMCHQFRCDLADFFLAEYGPEGTCRTVESFLMKFDEIYGPGRFDIQPGAGNRAPKSAATKGLKQAMAKFQDYLEPFLRDRGDVRLDLDGLREVLALVPAEIRSRSLSQSYLLQFAREGDERLAIVNQIFGGRSALMSRFLEVLDDEAIGDVRDYVGRGSDTGYAVELPGVFGFNANRHPRIADAELVVPPFPAGWADTDHIELASTSLAYDPQTHSVYFQTADGRPFEAFYQGFLIPSLLPSIQRILALTFGDGPSQFAFATMVERDIVGPAHLTQLPRLRLGSLVVQRRMWIIPFNELPDIDLPPAEFFVAIQSWRAAHGFPNEAFVRVIPIEGQPEGDKTETIDWNKIDFKNIKPFYVQFDSPRFVRLMQRMLRRNAYSISLTELLPGLGDQHVELDGEHHVAELQIELTRPLRQAGRKGAGESTQAAAAPPAATTVEAAADDGFRDRSAIRIAYYDPERTALLLGPVREAIQSVRSRFGPIDIALQTQWKFGPHIELTFDGGSRAGEIFELVGSVVDPWLASHPSTKAIDPDAYAALSAKIGMSELDPGPYEPLVADNSVTQAPFQPASALGIPELVESKHLFLSDTLDLTLDLLALKTEDPDAFSLTLIAMMAICGTTYVPHGLSRGFMSFRSHAEYFFAAYDGQGKLRPQFDALETAKAAHVDRIFEALAEDDYSRFPVPAAHRNLLERWAQFVRRTAERNERIVADNHDRLLADATFDNLVQDISATAPIDYQNRARARETSELGRAFDEEEGMRIRSSAEFIAYRTTVNFFYLILPTLGVSPLQKFCFCHLLANGAERHFNIDWREIVGLAQAPAVD
jgi:lantibiotic biosynthesis dehydratase-like protein